MDEQSEDAKSCTLFLFFHSLTSVILLPRPAIALVRRFRISKLDALVKAARTVGLPLPLRPPVLPALALLPLPP